MIKFDQDLWKNFWYELKPRVRFAFSNVFFFSIFTFQNISLVVVFVNISIDIHIKNLLLLYYCSPIFSFDNDFSALQGGEAYWLRKN